MTKTGSPKKGSMAFYPRKRARRIYPRFKYREVDRRFLGFSGYKAGMTHVILETGEWRPVTILECPPITVFGARFYRRTPYGLLCVGDCFSERKHPRVRSGKPGWKDVDCDSVRLLCHTNPPFKKTPEVFELPLGGSAEEQVKTASELLGKDLEVSSVFSEGEYVDVTAVTKGKGYSGPVKRFGIKTQGRKAKQVHRHVGSLGPENVARVRPTVPMPGQLGFQTRTEFNKRILKFASPDEVRIKGGIPHYGVIRNTAVLLEGSVPGPKKRLVFMKVASRPPAPRSPVKVSFICTSSQQGV